ncbi:hypothetical protein [Frankia sp. Cppng1_Ct_nod]|uniref:hypothetical protein n=1 Tax=Frankia sp. Cppng1_Ct_nod TaxID=2897162 RepID=UPI001040EC43|nr:hypothetical protein [Frankia sp. Cppng1_Ct_nod]
MAVGERNTVSLIRDLTSSDNNTRMDSCGVAEDQMRFFSLREVQTIARVLVHLALAEDDPECRECQLHTLAEFSDLGVLDKDDFKGLEGLEVTKLDASSQEYIQSLTELGLVEI